MIREDWASCRVIDIIELMKNGSSAKQYNEKIGLPITRIETISNETIDLKRVKYIKESDEGLINKHGIKYGDILLSHINSDYHLGKTAIFKYQSNTVIHGINLLLIRLVEKINPDFINYQFKFLRIKGKFIEEAQRAVNQSSINQKKLKTFPILLAPLPEQRAIVAKIEELFSELDSGIDSLNKAKKQLEVYRQAVLKSAFEGKLTKEWRGKNQYSMDNFLINLKKLKKEAVEKKLITKSNYFPKFKNEDLTYNTPENWISLPWKSIVSNNKYAMKRGPFGSSLKKEFFVDNGIVVYEQGHAINNDPFRHRYYISDEKYKELKAFTVRGGDMIISCSGVTLGRICLLPDDADVGVINQALLKIDINEEIILKKFFLLLFRSETFQRLIFKKAQGTAMPNMVGMKELKEIPIPIPSIEEQAEIIKEIESRLSVCDNIETTIEEALQKSEALRQSILKKAFEGKLLSKEEIEACKQEDDWEPADKLLKRIKEATKEAK